MTSFTCIVDLAYGFCARRDILHCIPPPLGVIKVQKIRHRPRTRALAAAKRAGNVGRLSFAGWPRHPHREGKPRGRRHYLCLFFLPPHSPRDWHPAETLIGQETEGGYPM